MTAGDAADSFRLAVPAEAGHMTTVRAFAAAVARRFGFDEDVIEDLKLAISEACAEPIDAGVAGEIEVLVRDDDGALRYEVRCAPWTPVAQPPADGAFVDRSALVRALFDDAESTQDGGSAVTTFSTSSRAAAGR